LAAQRGQPGGTGLAVRGTGGVGIGAGGTQHRVVLQPEAYRFVGGQRAGRLGLRHADKKTAGSEEQQEEESMRNTHCISFGLCFCQRTCPPARKPCASRSRSCASRSKISCTTRRIIQKEIGCTEAHLS